MKRRYDNPCQITIQKNNNDEMFVLKFEDTDFYCNKRELLDELSSYLDKM